MSKRRIVHLVRCILFLNGQPPTIGAEGDAEGLARERGITLSCRTTQKKYLRDPECAPLPGVLQATDYQ